MTVMETIYFDHAATTPLHPEVINKMTDVMKQNYGNPSSIHQYGRHARKVVDEARRVIAQSISADERDIIFTSGGTEADNLAVIGTALKHKDKGKHIITTNIEHHAVLDSCHYLESIGFDVTYLPVNAKGVVEPTDVKQALRDDTILVSIMMVNNEVGSIQPIESIGSLIKDHQAYFHTDAVQAYGIMPIDVNRLHVDLLTVTAHKINGPKGIGALYKKHDMKLQALHFGGEQERKRRPGTENIVGIVGFKSAVELMHGEELRRNAHYERIKQLFFNELNTLSDVYVNSALDETSPLILNVSFLGTHIEQVLMNLDLEGILVSSGSACTAGAIESSHVLTAMHGEQSERTKSAIRFSFGINHSDENIKEAARRVKQVIERLRKLNN